jgi:CDP-diacylglycerol--serine O-phosphatidyltransferase
MFTGPGLRGRLPLNSLAPNILTTLALCFGLTAIRFALAGRWKAAVFAIILAAIFDALDGRVARLLKGTSKFGAELDSLSDFLSFGVAPVVMLYLWTLHGMGNFGWFAVLWYATCCALRLARFNSALEKPNQPDWAGNFFVGIPAPAAAGLVLLPAVLSFQVGGDESFARYAGLNFVWAILVGIGMISRLPTFSFKKMRIRRDLALPLLLGAGLYAAALITEPWVTLFLTGVAYLAMIPFSVRAHARYRQRDAWPDLMEKPLIDTGIDGEDDGDDRPPPPAAPAAPTPPLH